MATGTEIAFITLGCAKNEVDTDKMKGRLVAAGYSIVDDPTEADLTVVNTCSFLASAVEEGIDTIFDALGMTEEESEGIEPRKVLVAGCMPSRYGDELADELTEVAGFIPADQEHLIVEKVNEALGLQLENVDDAARVFQGPSAYVKISDGCDRYCSYCMIPYIRGRYHSYPAAEIMREVDGLVSEGVKEIVFIGQDTGIWGKDLEGTLRINDLLEMNATRHPDTWFRILYIQPEGITDELLECMNKYDNVCSYIDIPLQHVDSDVLKAMNRSGSLEQITKLVEHVRETVPGIMVRTTLMAGFPGETDEQHELVLAAVDDLRFDYAGVFAYSQEEGSAAAAFENQVPEELRLERAQAVLDACDANGFARTAGHIGNTYEVLVEGYDETSVGIEALGRWKGQAPEVDGQVHIPIESEEMLPVGTIATVKIVDSFCYELEGELV